MWVLTQEKTGEIFPMFPNIQYKVGRLSADLVLKNDKSISGTHAFLTAKQPETGVSFLELEDAGSKNGTFVNEDIKSRNPLKKNSPVKLYCDNLNRVQFGVMGNTWCARFENLSVVSSGLTSEESKNLELLLKKFGGKHFNTIDEFSTHLTMKEIKVTLKVIIALLAEIPIVNYEYWQELQKIASKQSKGPMPANENYLPRITDVLLAQQDVDFRNRVERKSVFAGKTFVFLSQKHYETYAPIVEKAGGCSRGLKSGVQKAFLLKKNVIVVQYIPSTESQNSQGTQTINTIAEYLETNSRRFIPEYEIALAIIHCSTQNYCNPDYKTVSNIILSTSTLQDSGSYFVENTSAITDPVDRESCNLLILETELDRNSEQEQTSSERESNTKNLLSNKNVPAINSKKSVNSKRSYELLSSDSESETELTSLKKKLYLEKQVEEKRPESHASCSKRNQQFSNRTLNVTVSKTTQQVHKQQTQMPDMSEDEEDLFNFGDESSLSPVAKKKCTDLNGSHLNSHKNKAKKSNGVLNVDEAQDDLIPTQPFISKRVTKSTPTTTLHRKILPKKISTEGWQTFTGKSDFNYLKTETNEQITDIKIKDEDDWKCSEPFKGGFHIKLNATILRGFEEKSLNSFDNSEKNLSAARNMKNTRGFKKFIKQKFLQRQHPISCDTCA